LWQRRFAGSDAIVGQAIRLDGQPHVVIGVLPAGLRFVEFPRAPDIWLPLGSDPFADRRFAPTASMGAVAHLRAGVTREQAQAAMATLAQKIGREFPPLREWTLRLRPMRDQIAADRKPMLLALLGGVGVVLLITCANLANLMLARGSAREREIAVRLALGASRGRIARQLFAESLLLAGAGGIAGMLVAQWGTDALAAIAAGEPNPFVPWRVGVQDLSPDVVTLLFAAAVSTAAAVLFGLGPAWRASGVGPSAPLRDLMRGSGGRDRSRQFLIGTEVALSVVLLTGAALFARSFVNLSRVETGFVPEQAVALDVPLSSGSYAEPQRTVAFADRLTARAAALPGVRAAGAATLVPLGQAPSTDFRIESAPEPEAGREPRTEYAAVTPDWFKAAGIRIVEGRGFTSADDAEATRVAVINRTMATMYFGGQNPVGRRFALSTEALRFPAPNRPPVHDFPSAYRTIVGVVADVRQNAIEGAPAAAMYMPFAQAPDRALTLVVRAEGDPQALGSALARAVHAIDASQPVGQLRTLTSIVSAATDDSRFRARAMAALSGVALVLALLGIYGVVAYAVSQRTREIGIRIALGASRRHVVRLGVGAGLLPALAGTAIGLPVAALTARAIQSWLYRVDPIDLATFTAVTVVLIGVSVAASWIPARRAARIEPSAALRAE
jgi:putative ABC transport system permease protein